MYAGIGVFFFCLLFAIRLVPVSVDRRHLRVQHSLLSRNMLVELFWPILVNPLFVVPVMDVAWGTFLSLELHRHVGHQVFAGAIEQLPHAVQIVLALLLVDFTTYLRHRFVHYFAWPYHTIHHAAREIRWTTTSRLHPGDTLIMGAIKAPIMYVVGFDTPAVGTALTLYTLANWSNHINLNADFGFPLRYIFVSPNMHRWHHAADEPEAMNKNFAVVFAFIDVLFGTYYLPHNQLPRAYGVHDEAGRDVVSEGFLDQLLYPFRVHVRTVRSWLR